MGAGESESYVRDFTTIMLIQPPLAHAGNVRKISTENGSFPCAGKTVAGREKQLARTIWIFRAKCMMMKTLDKRQRLHAFRNLFQLNDRMGLFWSFALRRDDIGGGFEGISNILSEVERLLE